MIAFTILLLIGTIGAFVYRQNTSAPGKVGLPVGINQCVETSVKNIETRLEGAPGSGSAIHFTNGGYQVSYDQIPAMDNSKPGDDVQMCLTGIPSGCPAGDIRGRTYRVLNHRTGQSWEEPDSEHQCGGA